jgi:hypothetical protein
MSSRYKSSSDGWDEIFEDLILENEPPIRYIKEAVIVTKTGAKFKISGDDFAELLAKEKQLGPEYSNIHSCSLNIDFSKIKRDVNRWTNKFITEMEESVAQMIAEQETAKKQSRRRPSSKKID